MDLVILIPTAFITAAISGVIGMGGGMLLLAVMFCFMPAAEAIPLHAAVQLVSNGTRLYVFRHSVDAPTSLRFLGGVAPGITVAALLLWRYGPIAPADADPSQSSEAYLKLLIGLYILTVTYLPARRADTPLDQAARKRNFRILGFFAGLAAPTVGAVGPLIAPMFARHNYVKERLIATKAACQMMTHVLKILVFAILGAIVIREFSMLFVPMCIAVFIGTVTGKRLLRYVSPDLFKLLYRVALTVAGAKVLTHDGLYKLFAN